MASFLSPILIEGDVCRYKCYCAPNKDSCLAVIDVLMVAKASLRF
jgi:hypothetical protein